MRGKIVPTIGTVSPTSKPYFLAVSNPTMHDVRSVSKVSREPSTISISG